MDKWGNTIFKTDSGFNLKDSSGKILINTSSYIINYSNLYISQIANFITIYDIYGNVILDNIDDYSTHYINYIVVIKDKKYNIYNIDTKCYVLEKWSDFVMLCRCKYISVLYDHDIFIYDLINREFKFKIPDKYTTISSMNDYYIMISYNKYYNIMDINGNVLLSEDNGPLPFTNIFIYGKYYIIEGVVYKGNEIIFQYPDSVNVRIVSNRYIHYTINDILYIYDLDTKKTYEYDQYEHFHVYGDGYYISLYHRYNKKYYLFIDGDIIDYDFRYDRSYIRGNYRYVKNKKIKFIE